MTYGIPNTLYTTIQKFGVSEILSKKKQTKKKFMFSNSNIVIDSKLDFKHHDPLEIILMC